jgi:hypothetical protein
MATWVNNTSQSTGGNITMQVAGGYSGVSRSGNTVSGNIGIRFIASQWTYNSITAWYGGVRRWAQRSSGGIHTASGGTYYANAADTPALNYQNTTEVTPWSFSTTVSGTGSGNVSISITAGWNGWTPSAGYTKTFNVPYSGVPSNPTYSVSVSPSRTSAKMTMSITSNPSSFWRIHWYDTGGNWKGCSGFTTGTWEYSQSGLTPNTSYNFYTQIGAANDTNLKGSVARGFTTTGNAPTATGLPITNVTRTSANVSINGTYDTNASWGGWEVQYGTSTNYGSSGSSTLSNLTPNTTYYVRGRFYDNWGRWSGWVTNSFTTTGNAPTINSVSVKPLRDEVHFSHSTSYDTNDSYKSLSIRYGTSTSYGSTSNNLKITGLQPNTTYYYSMTVTSSKNRTSSAKTGSFKTTAYIPTGLSISTNGTLPFTTNVSVGGSGDTNAGITNYTVYYTPKINKPLHDMAIKALSDGSIWARVFYHNSKEGAVLFSSVSEAKNTQTTDKYSRLYLLDDNTFKGADGKFELMLCYPNDTTAYNRWKQTDSPCNLYTGGGSGTFVPGYEAIHIDWSGSSWGGMERNNSSTSSITYTYLDGSVGFGNWWYALAPIETYDYGMPGPDGVIISNCAELWVRIGTGVVGSKSLGTATSGTLSGLSEETEYMTWTSASNAYGTNHSYATYFTTLADQAKIRIKGNALPDTYQRVEYIQTDGAQMINLGKVGDTVAAYDIAFIDDSHRQLMGYGGSGTEYWGAYNPSYYEAGGSTGNISITTSQRRTVTWTYNYRDGMGGLDFDGYHIDSTPSKNVDDNEYKLFNILDDASAQYGCACKLYGLQMWHYGNLVRNLIPCYRKSDNIIGLFDTVGMTFYTNIGTGNFTKGGNVATGTGWLKGKTYFKKDNTWVKAKKIYIKVDGQWKIGTNYDD